MLTRTPVPTSAINITPMIDVLLVLLVIFMAVLPIAQRGLDVTLPADVDGQPRGVDTQIVVELGPAGEVSINSQPVARRELGLRLQEVFALRRDKTLYLLGAGSLLYADIVEVIDAAKGAGITRVGVITEGMRRIA